MFGEGGRLWESAGGVRRRAFLAPVKHAGSREGSEPQERGSRRQPVESQSVSSEREGGAHKKKVLPMRKSRIHYYLLSMSCTSRLVFPVRKAEHLDSERQRRGDGSWPCAPALHRAVQYEHTSSQSLSQRSAFQTPFSI